MEHLVTDELMRRYDLLISSALFLLTCILAAEEALIIHGLIWGF